jgi:hypothetical protein
MLNGFGNIVINVLVAVNELAIGNHDDYLHDRERYDKPDIKRNFKQKVEAIFIGFEQAKDRDYRDKRYNHYGQNDDTDKQRFKKISFRDTETLL